MKLDYTGRLISKLICAVFFGLALGLWIGAVSTLPIELLQRRLGMVGWVFFTLSVFTFGGGWLTEES